MNLEYSIVRDPIFPEAQRKASKGTKRKKPDPKKPPRPFTEYTIFFQLEREYIMQTQPSEDGSRTTPCTSLDAYVPLDHHPAMPARYSDLILRKDWFVSGKKKERRKHRKVHGKIGFFDLTRTISSRWASVDQETRKYCKQMALLELDKYKAAMKGYTASKSQQDEKTEEVDPGKSTYCGSPSGSLFPLCMGGSGRDPFQFERVEHASSQETDCQSQQQELLDILSQAVEIGKGFENTSRNATSTSWSKSFSSPLICESPSHKMKTALFFGNENKHCGIIKGQEDETGLFSSAQTTSKKTDLLAKYDDEFGLEDDVECFLHRLEVEDYDEISVPINKSNAIGNLSTVDDAEILSLWKGLA